MKNCNRTLRSAADEDRAVGVQAGYRTFGIERTEAAAAGRIPEAYETVITSGDYSIAVARKVQVRYGR